MGLKCNFTSDGFLKEAATQVDTLNTRMVNSFIRAGEIFVTQARSQIQNHDLGTYNDQTTNLRNSIGYYVFQDGELVTKKIYGNDEDNDDIAEQVKSTQGIQLIALAGMNYASYVESKGYNVITNQGDTMLLNLEGFLQTLGMAGKNYNQLVAESFDERPDNYEEGL